jgi:hypothetical protein
MPSDSLVLQDAERCTVSQTIRHYSCDSHVRVRYAAVNVTLYCHVRTTRALRRRQSTTAYAGPQADHWLTNLLLNTLPLRILYSVPLHSITTIEMGDWLIHRTTACCTDPCMLLQYTNLVGMLTINKTCTQHDVHKSHTYPRLPAYCTKTN